MEAPPQHQQAKHTQSIKETGDFEKRMKKTFRGACPNRLGSPRVWEPAYGAQPVPKAITEMWGHASNPSKQHTHMHEGEGKLHQYIQGPTFSKTRGQLVGPCFDVCLKGFPLLLQKMTIPDMWKHPSQTPATTLKENWKMSLTFKNWKPKATNRGRFPNKLVSSRLWGHLWEHNLCLRQRKIYDMGAPPTPASNTHNNIF